MGKIVGPDPSNTICEVSGSLRLSAVRCAVKVLPLLDR